MLDCIKNDVSRNTVIYLDFNKYDYIWYIIYYMVYGCLLYTSSSMFFRYSCHKFPVFPQFQNSCLLFSFRQLQHFLFVISWFQLSSLNLTKLLPHKVTAKVRTSTSVVPPPKMSAPDLLSLLWMLLNFSRYRSIGLTSSVFCQTSVPTCFLSEF